MKTKELSAQRSKSQRQITKPDTNVVIKTDNEVKISNRKSRKCKVNESVKLLLTFFLKKSIREAGINRIRLNYQGKR